MAEDPGALVHTVLTPLLDAKGRSRSRIQPYQPVSDPCFLCPARCCRLKVLVSLPDAARFCSGLGLPFSACMTVVESDHPTRSFALDRSEAYTDVHQFWRGRAELRLRTGESGACVALLELAGHARCGVYDVRPAACRTYPMSWTLGERRGGVEVVLCPLPYGVLPEEEARILADVRRSLDDWALHEAVVAEWNARTESARPLDGFLAFALTRTCESLGLSIGPALATDAPEGRLRDAMVAAGTLRILRSDPPS